MEKNKIIIYQTDDGQTQTDVRLENDTVWLTQAQMAELLQKDQSVVARHINNAIKDGELDESNMHFLHNTQYKYRPTKMMAINALPPPSSYGSSTTMASSIAKTVRNVLPTTPLSP